MLAGLIPMPADGADPAAPPVLAAPLPKGMLLPRVRQDPAVWLPGEIDLPAPESAPGLELPPLHAGPLVFGPDCEMPAGDPGLPQPKAAASVAEPSPVEPAAAMPPSWPLRLTSALTPPHIAARPARIDASAERVADRLPAVAVERADIAETAKLEPSTVPPAPSVEVAVVATVLVAAPPLTRDDHQADDGLTTAPVSVPVFQSAAEQTARVAPAYTPLPAQPHGDTGAHRDQGSPAHQQQAAARTDISDERAAEPLTPELARQLTHLVEHVSRPRSESASSPAPNVMAMPAPVPQPQPAPASPQPASPAYQPAPVDLGRAEWVQAMVDRIADLPQASGREAQIKLLPDALGAVEVKIVERDERMQVTLNADTSQARQLLSEAAPRLQELAEARGLRFAQTEVGGGTSQDRRSAPDQQQPNAPQRPRSASAGRDADPQPQGDLIA
jgi:flagellar hook-length control protein FliK